MIISEFLDTRSVAARLGVTPRTLWRWRRDGVGPVWTRVGRAKVGYRPAAIETYLAGGTCQTQAHQSAMLSKGAQAEGVA